MIDRDDRRARMTEHSGEYRPRRRRPFAALDDRIDAVEAQIDAARVPKSSEVPPDPSHGVIDGDWLRKVDVEGVQLDDWFTALVPGRFPTTSIAWSATLIDTGS